MLMRFIWRLLTCVFGFSLCMMKPITHIKKLYDKHHIPYWLDSYWSYPIENYIKYVHTRHDTFSMNVIYYGTKAYVYWRTNASMIDDWLFLVRYARKVSCVTCLKVSKSFEIKYFTFPMRCDDQIQQDER